MTTLRARIIGFFNDTDGVNRWTPVIEPDGNPRVDESPDVCGACHTLIVERWHIRHPTRGDAVVGRICINQVKLSFPKEIQDCFHGMIRLLSRRASVLRREAELTALIADVLSDDPLLLHWLNLAEAYTWKLRLVGLKKSAREWRVLRELTG